MTAVRQWGVFEAVLESDRDYDNPFWDVTVAVEITAPSGERRTVDAFWDGGRTWRVRVCPDEVGGWRWSTVSSEPDDTGLHDREGEFACEPYEGDNPLYLHGSLRSGRAQPSPPGAW